MKVKFNGIMTTIQTGCVPCGHGGTSTRGFKSSEWLMLPSGSQKEFHKGEVVEVSDYDGEWLLTLMYVDQNGMRQNEFTRVE